MTTVTAIREEDWQKDPQTLIKVTHVTLSDGQDVPGYDLPPGLEVGKPLPEGWEVATSKAGKPYLKPARSKKGGGFGGAPAWRNTAEGFAAEQDQMNRRTCLMQAVKYVGEDADVATTLEIADRFYGWLRSPSSPQRTGEKPGDAWDEGSDRSPSALGNGEGSPGAGGEHLSAAEAEAVYRVFGSKNKTLTAARKAFGDRVTRVEDLTRSMASELVDEVQEGMV